MRRGVKIASVYVMLAIIVAAVVALAKLPHPRLADSGAATPALSSSFNFAAARSRNAW